MTTNTKTGKVLIIAGSDSGGGAGIQADIKSVQAQGGAFAATAITALTAQNTRGVQGVHPVPPAFVSAQIDAVMRDIGADIIKTGMLHDRATIEAVAARVAEHAAPTVIDPVMVASSGDILLAPEAVAALEATLVRRAWLVTPNLPEARLLLGRDITTRDDMRRAADALLARGANAVLLKGGHAGGTEVCDLLAMQSGMHEFAHPRLASQNTHGTGCSLASAIAARLAVYVANNGGEGAPPDSALVEATKKSLDYIARAIASADADIGGGSNKPLNHLPDF